jgi:hypothetical protein
VVVVGLVDDGVRHPLVVVVEHFSGRGEAVHRCGLRHRGVAVVLGGDGAQLPDVDVAADQGYFRRVDDAQLLQVGPDIAVVAGHGNGDAVETGVDHVAVGDPAEPEVVADQAAQGAAVGRRLAGDGEQGQPVGSVHASSPSVSVKEDTRARMVPRAGSLNSTSLPLSRGVLAPAVVLKPSAPTPPEVSPGMVGVEDS